eukprot:308287_1
MLLLSTGVIAAISIGACCVSCCLYICCCGLVIAICPKSEENYLYLYYDIDSAGFILIHCCMVGFIVGIVTMCIGLILIYNSSISLTVLYCLLFLIIPIGCFCLILCVHGSTFNHDTYRKHGSYRLQ